MTPTFTLIGESFEVFFKKQNFIYFIKTVLVQLLIGGGVGTISLLLGGFIAGGVSYFYTVGAEGYFDPAFFAILVPLVLVVVAVAIILSFWIGAFNILVVSNVAHSNIKGIRETLKLAWKKVWKFFLVNLLMGIIVMLGLVLFVVPGIIFGIWFSFAPYFVVEGSGVVESLKQSKKLVAGFFWKTLLRYVIFAILGITIYTLISFIPVVGPISLMFFSPFYILLSYLVFLNLKKLRNT